MKIKGTEEEAKICDKKVATLLNELCPDPDLKTDPIFKNFFVNPISIQEFRELYKKSTFPQENLPKLTRYLIQVCHYFRNALIHTRLESTFKRISYESPTLQEDAELHFIENSIHRNNAYWEAIMNFIFVFENKPIPRHNKRQEFQDLVKLTSRWHCFDQYDKKMSEFAKKYTNPLKHDLSITVYYSIYGIQDSSTTVKNDLLTPIYLLPQFCRDLKSILEGKEYCESMDILSNNPDSINYSQEYANEISNVDLNTF